MWIDMIIRCESGFTLSLRFPNSVTSVIIRCESGFKLSLWFPISATSVILRCESGFKPSLRFPISVATLWFSDMNRFSNCRFDHRFVYAKSLGLKIWISLQTVGLVHEAFPKFSRLSSTGEPEPGGRIDVHSIRPIGAALARRRVQQVHLPRSHPGGPHAPRQVCPSCKEFQHVKLELLQSEAHTGKVVISLLVCHPQKSKPNGNDRNPKSFFGDHYHGVHFSFVFLGKGNWRNLLGPGLGQGRGYSKGSNILEWDMLFPHIFTSNSSLWFLYFCDEKITSNRSRSLIYLFC